MISRTVKQQWEEHASNAISLLRFFLLDRRAKSSRSEASLALWVGADSCRRFPSTTTINMAYTQQSRTADVAKTFDCDLSTVTQARALVAHASCMSYNNFQ